LLHRRQERDKGAAVDERERLPSRKVPSFWRVLTRYDENPAQRFLGVHDTKQLSDFVDPDSLRLPVLALDQDPAFAMEDQIDPAVWLGTAALLDRISLTAIDLGDQGFELLPAQCSDRVTSRLAVNEVSFAKLPDRRQQPDQQQSEREKDGCTFEPLDDAASQGRLLGDERRKEIPECYERDGREGDAAPPGCLQQQVKEIRRATAHGVRTTGPIERCALFNDLVGLHCETKAFLVP